MAHAKISQAKKTKKSDQPRPLGRLLSEVMEHPDTPVSIYNAIADSMCTRGDVSNSPELFQLLIDYANAHPGSDPELDQKANFIEEKAQEAARRAIGKGGAQ
jgi:hypothetical protein